MEDLGAGPTAFLSGSILAVGLGGLSVRMEDPASTQGTHFLKLTFSNAAFAVITSVPTRTVVPWISILVLHHLADEQCGSFQP